VNGNKVGVNNPKLMPLANNGGPTQTMLPMAGSPVIDAGSNALIPSGVTTDQRGLPRIFGKSVDIGADEYISLTLTGSVFNDKNGDGIGQSTDPGLANWQVFIDLNNNGFIVAGDPVATTNSAGNYTLTYLPTSTKNLIIREVRQNNWRRTKPAGIYPLGFYTIGPTAGTVGHLDFGNSTTALFTGTVYNDANSNGKKDSTENGLSNFRVYVDLNNDRKRESSEPSALTDANGNWSIAGLAPGAYVIRVVQQTGWKPTTPASGSMIITLSSGETLTGELFGEHAM
jgi:serine-aspartate repeat-containing protein C/D/E